MFLPLQPPLSAQAWTEPFFSLAAYFASLMLLVISFAQLKSSLRLKIFTWSLFSSIAEKCHITGSLHLLIVKPYLSHSGCQISYIQPSELHASCQLLCMISLVHSSLPLLSIGKCRRSCPQERETSVSPTTKAVSKFSQSWVKVESKLSQRAAGCVRTQERDCRLPDLASQAAAAGQCYRCQSATAATSTVLQVLRCYSRVLTRCKDATAEY